MCDIDYRNLTAGLEPAVDTRRHIIDIVCKKLNLTFAEINTKSRNRSLVIARQISMYIMLKNNYSLSEAGSIFNKDHATALHARNAVSNLIETDKNYRALIAEIEQCFKLQGIWLM